MFSPTGMLEQDDLEVWSRLGANLMGMPPTFRLCYDLASEENDRSRPYPGFTASLQSDRPAFSFYAHWAEMIAQRKDGAS